MQPPPPAATCCFLLEEERERVPGDDVDLVPRAGVQEGANDPPGPREGAGGVDDAVAVEPFRVVAVLRLDERLKDLEDDLGGGEGGEWRDVRE